MIHVCFALYDKVGHYSKFTGTAMVSLFENHTPPQLPSITVHLLHDNTLTEDNRDKFIQIADSYGQIIKFYNVEELCADKLAEINNYFPQAKESHFSIETFYRLFIPYLLLPQGIEKTIYLDSDIIVNLDISELWQIELDDKPIGAVPRVFMANKETSDTSEVIILVREGIIKEEDSFNAGVLLMSLKVLRNEKATIQAGMKFIGEHPQFPYFDQDILNYCFSTTYLKLPVKFNHVIFLARLENRLSTDNKILHYAYSKASFIMDMNEPYNQVFMSYFIKTPWIDDDTRISLNGGISPRKNHPVSVVIPLYNEEEFIGECLDSLLIQTFQDFEVIIVDDCSNDDSVKIVKEYAPKFNGRLKLTKTEKNSGNDCVPRNVGLMLARGEYIQFIDADDMILGTALETFYKAALFYDAEVVYTSSRYKLNSPIDISLYKDTTTKKMPNVQTEFTFDDPTTNLNRLLLEPGEGNFRNAWTKFVRRDFLIENKIFFPNLSLAGDFIWVINVYCHAKRFLRIATPLFFYRAYNDNSMCRTIRPPQEQVRHWFLTFVNFAKHLYDLERENEVLAENPLYCLMALKGHFGFTLNQTGYARDELDSEELFKVLRNEFAKNFSYSIALLLPFLFSYINENKANNFYVKIVNKFKRYLSARIDMKLMSTEGDLQIVSVSDKEASVKKPSWLQNDGIGYMIQSYVGELKIVAKPTADGQIKLNLKGIDVRDPEDKSKRIPYWIDYTKFIVNDKTIFDKIKPVWHDKPYKYTINVKADEEITIQAEWLPHRVDTVEQKIAPPPQPKSIPNKFVPFITARIDVRLMTTEGDFQIVSISDTQAVVRKPIWLQKNSIGYKLQSYAGKLKIVAKPTADGQIRLNLKGIDVRDPEDKSKRIPYWIDYTNFTINGKKIFDTLTPVWHDKPYKYTINVKADEEITIQAEWLPHRSET